MSGWIAHVLAAILRFFLPRQACEIAQSRTKFLVLRLDERLGNLLLTSPLLHALRRAEPDARIDALVAARKLDIWDRLPELNTVHGFEKRDLFRAPWRIWRLLAMLRRNSYDIVIDASHAHAFSFTHALLTSIIEGRRRVGHDRGNAELIYTDAVADPGGSEISRKLSLLRPLKIDAKNIEMHYPLTAAAVDHGLGRWIDSLPKPLLLVYPGGRKVSCRWPVGRYAELSRYLADRFSGTIAIVWGPGEQELATRLQALVPRLHIAPKTSVDELARVFDAAFAVVCGDTGPMHLAVARKLATAAIFVNTDSARWGHRRQPHLVLEHTDDQIFPTIASWLADLSTANGR